MLDYKNIELGIVQGRLIKSPEGYLQWFPQEYWESEFFLAASLKYNYIELIAERQHNENNPIWSLEGIEKIKELTLRNGLTLHAFCNDYIIEHSLIDNDDSLNQNIRLLSQIKFLKMKKYILPLFEQSELNENNFEKYKEPLIKIADEAQKSSILVCLETILNGENLLKLLKLLNHSNIRIVFDTGNRIAFGHDIYSDIEILGDEIQHVHIKDKNNKNENVLLGTGDVNFNKVFKSLSKIGYSGPYTFETFRGKDPLKTAKFNRRLVEYFISENADGN